mmetsp:Transcript_12979/g.21352  ORF Transcript_12979/g.21352 Transcript_12979/m.21352 type:complete len:85 (+) Transcript_12979:142-396(+)
MKEVLLFLERLSSIKKSWNCSVRYLLAACCLLLMHLQGVLFMSDICNEISYLKGNYTSSQICLSKARPSCLSPLRGNKHEEETK